MKKLLFVTLGALIASGCGKADPAEQPPDDEPIANVATETNDSVGTDTSTDAPAEPVNVAEATTEIIGEYDKAYSDFLTWYKAASAEERQSGVQGKLPDASAFASRLMDLVKEKPEAEDAATALAWIARNRTKISSEATDLLFKHHSSHEAMAKVIPGLASDTSEAGEKRLRDLVASASNEKVKALATITLARYLNNVPSMKKMVADNPQAAAHFADKMDYLNGFKENPEEIESLYQTIVDKYASISGARGGTLGEAAEGALFAMRNLNVGKEVPEIEGADLDGVDFKLSDYRGKVVLLDFWGNW